MKLIITEEQYNKLIEANDSTRKKASVIALKYNGKLLIVQRASTIGWMPNKWALIGGEIEEGETPEEAIIRECQEEIGLTPENIKFVKKTNVDSNDYEAYYFTGTINSDEIKLNSENQDYKLINPNELDNYDVIPTSINLIKYLGSLTEAAIRIPQEMLRKANHLYNYLFKNKDFFEKQSNNRPFSNPYIPSTLKDFFSLNDLKNNPISVSVGLYGDENDGGIGRMDTKSDTLLINYTAFSEDKEEFLDTIEHELVHAMDPLVRDKKIYNTYFRKKDNEYDTNPDNFHKSQHEYNAYLTTLITRLKKGKISPKFAVQFLNYMKNFNGSDEDLFSETPEEVKNYLSFGDKNPNYGYFSFIVDYLDVLKSWGTKETLFNDAMKKIYTSLS
jgi:mutator protein MutT